MKYIKPFFPMVWFALLMAGFASCVDHASGFQDSNDSETFVGLDEIFRNPNGRNGYLVRVYLPSVVDNVRYQELAKRKNEPSFMTGIISSISSKTSTFGAIQILNQLYPEKKLPATFNFVGDKIVSVNLSIQSEESGVRDIVLSLELFRKLATAYWTQQLFPPSDIGEELRLALKPDEDYKSANDKQK